MKINLDKINKIHFIGIGGIMMSSVAQYFLGQGRQVSGSDRDDDDMLDYLRFKGVQVSVGHNSDNIESDVDLVVYTVAIGQDNPEFLKAKKLGKPLLSVYQILGQLCEHKFVVAVSGMHGKSTTSSILGLIMEQAGFDPTVFLGTKIKEWKNNFRYGESNYLLSEACEYRDNFLQFFPDILVITNIEAEHLDYFHNLVRIRKSFMQLIDQVRPGGYIVANWDDENVRTAVLSRQEFFHKRGVSLVKFGASKDELDFKAIDINMNSDFSEFKILTGRNDNIASVATRRVVKKIEAINFKLKIPGRFNIYNTMAAITAAIVLGVEPKEIKDAIDGFEGVWRRFEFKGEVRGVRIYDDYAHHPTEIEATLKAVLNKFGIYRIWLVFQPHLYSRTNDFRDSFRDSLNLAPNLIIAPIYAARETNKWDISGQDLVDDINSINKNSKAVYYDNFDDIVDFLNNNIKAGDIVMTMGAGDVYKIGDRLINNN